MAKSLIGLLVGLARADGRIASLDDPVSRYASELAGTAWNGISIRDVLRMSSGVSWAADEDTRRHVTDLLYRDRTLVASLAGFTGRSFAPGSRFQYNNANTSVLALVLARVYGRPPSEVFSERIWSRIGAEHDAYWLSDVEGIDVGLAYFNATARDYAKLGQLLLDDGVAGGERVVPADWLHEQTGGSARSCPFAPNCISRKWGYGYQTWLLPDGMGPFFWGKYGQFIIVLPRARAVIVQTAVSSARPSFSDDLLEIVRAVHSEAAGK